MPKTYDQARCEAEEAVVSILENMVMEGYKITEDSTFCDMGLDSLDKVELAMELEEELNVDIDDEELLVINSVKDIVESVTASMMEKQQKLK